MPRKTNFAVILLLLFYTSMHAQESQTARPSQPTSSVYNRMRPTPPAQANGTQQQAQQFPNPSQQFPPEQRVGPMPGQVPNFSRRPLPSQPVNQQQNGPFYSGMAPAPNAQPPQRQPAVVPNAQQAQQPYGLALQPANPPNVSYANGQLTIVANNSSLSDIVSGIERSTGVRVEGTRPDAERVFGQFGPGSSRDVLNSLFDGSRYDFILVGDLENPSDVRTIILSPHGTASAGTSTANAQPYRSAENNEGQEENEAAPVRVGGGEIGQPVQPVPTEQVTPLQPPPAQQQQQQQVKTPEQLLQELQRLRQQQQQGQQPQTPR